MCEVPGTLTRTRGRDTDLHQREERSESQAHDGY
jgi:hypothetical protein